MKVPELFKSRRWWSGVVGLLFMGVVHFVPALVPDAELLTKSALVIVSLLIGGFSATDSAEAFAAKK